MKKDEINSLTGRTICTRSVTNSTSTPASIEPGLRRSNRGTPSKKPITPASSTRKSERLASSPASLRTDKGKTVLSDNAKGPDKLVRYAVTSPESDQGKKNKRRNNVEESTSMTKKREPIMSARSFRALIRGKLKQSATLVDAQSNDEELVVLGCSRSVPACNDDANSVSKELPVGETSLVEGTNTPLKSSRETEQMVLDASLCGGTGDDNVKGSPFENSATQKLHVSKTSLETGIDFRSERKRETGGIVLDTCATVANGDNCITSSDGASPSPPGGKTSYQPETRSTCEKQQKVNGFENLSLCSSVVQPGQDSDNVVKDLKETGPSTSREYGENMQNTPHDKSYDLKLHSATYPEYWIPVQLSGVQMEQYCWTLFSKSLSLSLLPRNDFVGALEETLVSVRKTCDHPYVTDASLKQLLTKNLEVHELLDVEVKASGKLHLLDAMLNQIREKGLKAVVFYQASQSSGGLLLGNILEDFLGQRFGQKSYEHGIYEHGVSSSRKSAINNFNKETQCFVLLLEKRACTQTHSIKLLRADAFIFFGSSLNPSHDIKHIEKIKIEGCSEKPKIFRLYSACTVEERALILARHNKPVPVENLSRSLIHALLMWGASYLFDKLDNFHGSEISGVPLEQSIMDGVIHEFSYVLSNKGEKKNEGKPCLLLEARYALGTYSTDSILFGEEHVKLSDEDGPNIFWKRLLKGKNPMWKYHSDIPQRNRKRVRYFQDSKETDKIGSEYHSDIPQGNKKRVHYFQDPEENDEIGSEGCVKELKKTSDDVADPPVTDSPVDNDGRKTLGALGSQVVALQSSRRSASGTDGTVNGNDALGFYSTAGHISGIPEDMLAGKDRRQMLCESQKSLHSVLKSEMEKLGKVLDFSENWTSMVEKYLGYIIVNHRVCEEPATTLQAFQMALSWIAAFLVKHKFKREESLVRAKSELSFNCSREEVDYIYSMLYCMKSLFLESAQGLQLDCFSTNSKKSMVSTKQVNESLSEGEESMTEKRGSHYSTVTNDIKKTINDIRKKCKKKEQALVKTHQEKKVELLNMFAEKKRNLETKKKLEAAVIRIACSGTSTQSLEDDLKRLDHDFRREYDEMTSEKEKCLKSLKQTHEAAKKKLAEDEAFWISRIEKWAQAELKKFVPIRSGNNTHLSVYQTNDRMTSAAPDEDGFSKLPEISQSFAISASPELSSNIEEAFVTTENDRICHIGSDADTILDQQNEDACSLDKEIPDVELPMPQPASVVVTRGSAGLYQDDQDVCPMASSPAEKQPDPGYNTRGQNSEAPIDPPPTGSETVETGGQVTCPLTSPPAGNQSDPAAIIEGHNIETSAEPHIAGPDTRDIGDSAVSDQDACSLPSELVGTQSAIAANIEGQNIRTVSQLYTAGSNAVETDTISDQGAHDASPLPLSSPGNHPDIGDNTEDLNNTTVSEPHTTGSDPCEMDIIEPGPQVEQSAFANNLVHEGSVELSAGVTASVPSLLNNGTGQSTVQLVPRIPFPVFNDPFQYELEKLRRESQNTKKIYEEKKSILKAELERKIAEARAEYRRKFNEVESEHKARVVKIQKNKNFGTMNKLLASAFLSKCINNKNVSYPSAVSSGRIQMLALSAAQDNALRNYTTPAAVPLQRQASSFPSSVSRPSDHPLHSPMLQPRQPSLISNTAPSPSASVPTNPDVNARLRSLAPHLNAYRSSSPSSIPTVTATPTPSSLPKTLPYSAALVQHPQ